eukprot:3488995-Prorocentrum_lima.AAC.1
MLRAFATAPAGAGRGRRPATLKTLPPTALADLRAAYGRLAGYLEIPLDSPGAATPEREASL